MPPGDKKPRGAVPKNKKWDTPSGLWVLKTQQEIEADELKRTAKLIANTDPTKTQMLMKGLLQRASSESQGNMPPESESQLDIRDNEDESNEDDDYGEDKDAESDEESDLEERIDDTAANDVEVADDDESDDDGKSDDEGKSDGDGKSDGGGKSDDDEEDGANDEGEESSAEQIARLQKQVQLLQQPPAKKVKIVAPVADRVLKADVEKKRKQEKEEMKLAEATARKSVSEATCFLNCPKTNPQKLCLLPTLSTAQRQSDQGIAQLYH